MVKGLFCFLSHAQSFLHFMLLFLSNQHASDAYCKETESREREQAGNSEEEGWGGKIRLRTACVVSPQPICGESYMEASAKLPENAAITHWGSGVITESFCPHLPTVISLKALQLRS